MAAATMTTKTATNLASSKFGVVAGNQERAMPEVPRPTRVLATGVRNPINSEAPLATASKPTAHVPKVGLSRSDR